jgi:hypothetical protein
MFTTLALAVGGGDGSCSPSDTKCGWTWLLDDKSLGLAPFIRDMDVDLSGNIFVAGETIAATSGPNQSSALIARLGANGTLIWSRLLAAPGIGLNVAYGVAADGAGNLCLVGATDGAFGQGRAQRGGGFVARYDTNGELQWALNTPAPPWMVGMDDKGSCVTASFNEVIKFDYHGNLLWLYPGNIGAMAVSGDGKVYFTGASGSAPQPLLTVLDTKGQLLSKADFALGKSVDWSQYEVRDYDLAVDSQGNILLKGTISGVDRAGNNLIESFLARLENNGNVLWERHYGTRGYRWDPLHVAVDNENNVYMVGRKMTVPSASPYDAFAISYRMDGSLRWAREYGTPKYDGAGRIGFDAHGNFYISGGTEGDLDGQPNLVPGTAQFISRNRPFK